MRVKIDVDLEEFAAGVETAIRNSINLLVTEGAADVAELLVPIGRRIIVYAADGNDYMVGKLAAQALAVPEISRIRANKVVWATIEAIWESAVSVILGILGQVRKAGGIL